ncbi:hypothetical protein BDZ89DRAFT_1050418 [Hymenopellis radicata]|nr:hypothetical protein BDZ89DRAFT_1050418 [Hymenopellis radicata]
MAPIASPQSAAITELTDSGLSPTAFWLLLCIATAPSVYFYLIPRFWPRYIIASTLERCKEVKGSLKDIPLEHLSAQQQVVWDQTCSLMDKMHDLRSRDYSTRQGGVIAIIRALRELYREARALSAEMDKIEMKLDVTCYAANYIVIQPPIPVHISDSRPRKPPARLFQHHD